MHRPKPQAPERRPAVPADRLGAKQLVLRATRGVGREPCPDAGHRPPVHQAAVLRDAEGSGTLRHQSEEGSAAHAFARPRGRLSEAIDQPPGSWPQGLPVFTAEYGDYEADQVWASDITYIPLQHGFLYLTAVMDLYSRNVLS
jgi:transposase InsO family protein